MSLAGLGSWGSNLLGQASSQLGKVSEQLGVAEQVEQAAASLKAATKSVKSTLKENLGGLNGFASGFTGGETHTFPGVKGGPPRIVTEVSFIAEGGFGAVVKVSESKTGQSFALKKIKCAEGVQIASTLQAAEAEAQLLTKLPPHPNILQCLGYITDNHGGGSSTVKILLELCSGGHLLDYQDARNGKLSPKEVMEPFVQIVEGVRHLHSQNPPIQHRDLKVENVLMGNDGKWKLCDFGSCSTQQVPATELSRPAMMNLQEEIEKTVTMLYRPPEMVDIDMNYRQGYAITTQVDLWMLGCILYTLAFYRHPFQDSATAMAIWNAKYFIPGDHPMAQSPKLCALIHWLLAPVPQERPSADRLIEACKAIGKAEYSEFLAALPSSVQKKIASTSALYTARKEKEVPIEWDLNRAKSGPAAASSRSSGSRAAANGKASPAKNAESEFDLRFALSAEAPGPGRSAGTGGYNGNRGASVANGASATNANAHGDLLSLDSGPGTAQMATSAPSMDDLLGFTSAPAPPVALSRATSAPAAAVPDNTLIGFADFGSPAAALPHAFSTPATGAVPSSQPNTTATFDFADFSAAPQPNFADFSQQPPVAPAQATNAPSSQPQGQTANLLDLF
eukprot:TRINITY_DN79238_c0_g1_i1.p1 TRINITY_DN79238_c0_g1~~TRINITY_DN79238_c0_g1_i1.p1  ORF type:complete len:622 (+),score=125.46 TRINITY_DN79238_c0_g1_i1:124-1989(+)